MNKIFTIFIVILLLSFSITKADIFITTTHEIKTPGTEFSIPIIITGASEEGTPISSANIVFTFDTAAVQFLQFHSFNSLTPQNQWFFSGNNNTGIVAANWLEPALDTVALSDGSIFYYIKFKAKPGACAFTFITLQFTDVDYLMIPTTFENGSYASLQQVTFQVNMRDQVISPNGVHLSGSFNDWSTTATTMTAGDSSIYSATVQLISDSTYYYRFVNGNNSAGYETVPDECGVLSGSDYVRMMINPGGDTTLSAFCFSSCDPCPNVANVTFQADMRDQNVGAEGVHIAGSFNDWSPSEISMTPLGSSTTYTVTLTLLADSIFNYKFINGNTSGGSETVPVECGILYEGSYVRSINILMSDTVVPEVCFSSCDTCPPQALVSFRVDMSQQIVNSNGVHLAGSFNGWDPDATLMNNLGNDIFGVTIPLIIGTDIEYRFVNGNTESGYEIVPSNCGVPAGGELYNRFLTVPGSDTTLMDVCFSNCSGCLTIWPVIFKVDMSEEIVGPDGVHLAGSFNGFNPAAIPMTNQGNDVYFVTLDLLEDELITYRFVNGDDASGFETVPESCGLDDGSGTYNRYFTVPDNDTILGEVCFGNCEDCSLEPWEKNITFQVDMSNEIISENGVYLAGTFNGWNPAANRLIHQGNNIYFTTLILEEDDIHQYRFINGNTTAGYETVPAECGYSGSSGGLERQIIIPSADSTLDLVCFSSCSACVVFEVKLQVDMMREIVSVNGVHLAGTLNDWNTAALEMLSSGGTIYETTIQVYQGDTLFYRFVNGDQEGEMESVPADCGWLYNGLYYARYLIPVSDTIIGNVCYSWCDPCDVGFEEQSPFMQIGAIFPNPADRYVKIPLNLPEKADIMLFMVNTTGTLLESQSLSLNSGYQEVTFNTEKLGPGIYYLNLRAECHKYSSQKSFKILIIR